MKIENTNITQLEGSWPALFDAVDEHFNGPQRRIALIKLYEAVSYLVDACPDDNAVQMAARRGGQLVSDADDANSAVQMMRAGALVEILQEAQKEKATVTAYRRILKALRLLGIATGHPSNLILYALEYHDRQGNPYDWLAKKLAEKKGA